jgi:hypothetical protein
MEKIDFRSPVGRAWVETVFDEIIKYYTDIFRKENPNREVTSKEFRFKDIVHNNTMKPLLIAGVSPNCEIIISTGFYDLLLDFISDVIEPPHDISFYFYTALNFVLMHEIGHMYFGHVNLLKGANLGMQYNEKTGLTLEKHNVMELDADVFATRNIHTIIRNLEGKENHYLDGIEVFAMLFLFFTKISHGPKAHAITSTHPSHYDRLLAVLASFVDEHERQGGKYEKSLTDSGDYYANLYRENILLCGESEDSLAADKYFNKLVKFFDKRKLKTDNMGDMPTKNNG